jgi:hypothetical protein
MKEDLPVELLADNWDATLFRLWVLKRSVDALLRAGGGGGDADLQRFWDQLEK